MAEASKNPETSARPSRGGKVKVTFFLLLGLAALPFLLPTVLVCLGLLPTLVALVADADRQKSSAMTIGFMNLAGVTPFLIDLWQQGQTMEAALHILGQSNTWLIMFGAAGIGKLLLYAIPPAMATLTLTRMEVRLRALKDGLEQLKAIWGPEIATSTPLDQVRKKEG